MAENINTNVSIPQPRSNTSNIRFDDIFNRLKVKPSETNQSPALSNHRISLKNDDELDILNVQNFLSRIIQNYSLENIPINYKNKKKIGPRPPTNETNKTTKSKPQKTKQNVNYQQNMVNYNQIDINNNLQNKISKFHNPIEINISDKYLINRASLQLTINDMVEKYKGTEYNNKDSTKGFQPLRHQLFVKEYLKLENPYRGLMLFHGLGSGKTCSSIGIIEGLKYDKKVFILAPASLEDNYKTQIQFCGDDIYNSDNFWYEYTLEQDETNKIDILTQVLSLPPGYIKKHNYKVWLIDPAQNKRNDLTSEQLAEIKDQITTSINYKYNFISHNGKLKQKKFFNRFTKGGKINPFDHSVVCIDEAHNLINNISNVLTTKKGSETNTYKLYHLLMNAENVKIILLTGTPIVNHPSELAIALNILRGFIKTIKIKLNIKTSDKITTDTFKQLFVFQGASIHDYIDYDSSKTTLTITKNPYGFINSIDNQGNESVKLDQDGNITFDFFKQLIFMKIQQDDRFEFERKNFKPSDISVENYLNLPHTKGEFEGMFITDGVIKNITNILETDLDIQNKTNQIKALDIINKKNEFKLITRSIGLISYLGDKENLMPSIVRNNIIPCVMSDYQTKIYSSYRSDEIKFEKNRRIRAKKKDSTEDDELSSTYRINTRLACNFVFPDGIQRPNRNIYEISDNPPEDKTGEELLDGAIPHDQEELQNESKEAAEDDMEDDTLSVAEKDNLIKIQKQEEIALIKLQETADKHLDESNIHLCSEKFNQILKNVNNDEYAGNHLIYSQFRNVEGIEILKLMLLQNGYAELSIRKNQQGIYVLNIREEDLNKPKFALYTGIEKRELKEQVRLIFNNEWDMLNPTLRNQLNRLDVNSQKNIFGDICKIFMITASGAEGINLKNVRFVHLLEPYWHPVRLAQVIGRARRIRSHDELPPEYRNIETFLYLSVFHQKYMDRKSNQFLKEISANDNGKSTDEYLNELQSKKYFINNEFIDKILNVSIDCTLYNNDSQGKCFKIDNPDSRYLSVPDYKVKATEATKDVIGEKRIKYKVATYKNIKYVVEDETPFYYYDHDKYVSSEGEIKDILIYKNPNKKSHTQVEHFIESGNSININNITFKEIIREDRPLYLYEQVDSGKRKLLVVDIDIYNKQADKSYLPIYGKVITKKGDIVLIQQKKIDNIKIQ